MNSVSHGISVTLCCAPADADHLRPLADHLSKLGLPTIMLEGIESDPHRLGPALDVPGACLFVVCMSESLGTAAHRRITGVYSARKGPMHYLAKLLVEPDETLAMAETIHAALAKVTQAKPDKARSELNSSQSGSRLRDVVTVTGISAIGSDAIPSGNTRIPTEPRQNERAPSREDSVSGSYAIPSRKLLERETPKPKQPKPEPNHDTPEPKPKPAATPVKPAASRSSKSVPIVLFVVLLAVAGTVVLVNSQELGSKVVLGRGRGAPNIAPGETVGADKAKPEAAVPDSSDNDTTTGTDTDSGEDSDSSSDEVSIIRDAIASGEMRAVDLILVASPGGAMSWRDASNDCRAMSYRGVRSWRLPSLDELKTLRGARMLERDRYWSSTLATNVGEGQDHVYVLDLAARSIEPVSKDASDVRVRCVRSALPTK